MPAKPVSTTLPLLLRLKWRLFALLQRAAHWRAGEPADTITPPPQPRTALWVFATTIGELNAIAAYVDALRRRCEGLQLVLISDRALYRQAYLTRYPDAVVHICSGDPRAPLRLAQHYPPQFLVLAEIPCQPADAPCRFSIGYLLSARAQGARLALVNAWFYDGVPSCRIDALEQRWFAADYLPLFDALGAQTEAVHARLLVSGAAPSSTGITGNLKFDALLARPEPADLALRSPLLADLLASTRPILVAGCVTSFEEQALLLDAFVRLRQARPDALLVLAPRHPELSDRMKRLREFLDQRGLSQQHRSMLALQRVDARTACLVLDTVGELRDFYAAADLAHVGVNHNALEPLSFNKPVTVIPGWLPDFGSYSIYLLLMERACLYQLSSAEALAQQWLRCLSDGEWRAREMARIAAALHDLGGATERNLALLFGPTAITGRKS